MSITDFADATQYDSAIKNINLTVVLFWADFADECEIMKNAMLELAKTCPGVSFCRLEAEKFPEISMKHEIQCVPTVILFKAGKAVDRIDGANAGALTEKVNTLDTKGPQPQPAVAAAPEPEEPLNDKLKRLINSHDCMLFMKGSPLEPKCGFSRTIVGLLKEHNIDYGTFDILTDDAVRQGLKTFSDWPTYPQLYHKGELIGGLDIVKEMIAAGELQDTLPKKQGLEDRLKALINKAPVMVFMKGEPTVPKCGFSRQLMDILQETQVKFEHFDILTDEQVRQELKKFSNWPTYPQVYVKGELIGGLDIIKELKASDELVGTLNG